MLGIKNEDIKDLNIRETITKVSVSASSIKGSVEGSTQD